MNKKLLLTALMVLAGSVFGVNAQTITIDTPQNITYNSTNTDLNVSTTFVTIEEWFYNLDSNLTNNITFTPNTTIENLTQITHRLEVFVNGSNTTGSLYGHGNYGLGLYGFADTQPFIISQIVFFNINQVLRWHIMRITGLLILLVIMLVVGAIIMLK